MKHFEKLTIYDPRWKLIPSENPGHTTMIDNYPRIGSTTLIDINQKEHQTSLNVSIKTFIDYEVRSSRWASKVSAPWLQKLAGKYFAWKVKRKYDRYITSMHWKNILNK